MDLAEEPQDLASSRPRSVDRSCDAGNCQGRRPTTHHQQSRHLELVIGIRRTTARPRPTRPRARASCAPAAASQQRAQAPMRASSTSEQAPPPRASWHGRTAMPPTHAGAGRAGMGRCGARGSICPPPKRRGPALAAARPRQGGGAEEAAARVCRLSHPSRGDASVAAANRIYSFDISG